MLDLQGYGPSLLAGASMTIAVGLSAMVMACILGLVGAWAKLSASYTARATAAMYTTVIRGTPELILLLLLYYGVPTLVQDLASLAGYEIILNFNPFLAGAVTLGLIYGAFATEVFRGAFEAIPRGQTEAAQALGMSRFRVAVHITLPQAMRIALPGLGNVWMILIKATALVSIIQLDEVMRKAKIAAGATHQPFTFYLLASFIFLGITLISSLVQRQLEKKAHRGVGQA